jgi:2'-5' RNA ligase
VRTFVAVFPPEPVLQALVGLREELEPVIPGLRWVALSNLHFTLRFFGDLTRDEITRASAVVDEVASGTVPFELELSGVGVFPNWKRPRVLWVGSGHGGAVLEALARSLERGFRDVGLGKSDKDFAAHLTLGRWRDSRELDLRGARDMCDAVGSLARFPVSSAQVVESRLTTRGAVYQTIHAASLGRNFL